MSPPRASLQGIWQARADDLMAQGRLSGAGFQHCILQHRTCCVFCSQVRHVSGQGLAMFASRWPGHTVLESKHQAVVLLQALQAHCKQAQHAVCPAAGRRRCKGDALFPRRSTVLILHIFCPADCHCDTPLGRCGKAGRTGVAGVEGNCRGPQRPSSVLIALRSLGSSSWPHRPCSSFLARAAC